MPGRPETIVRFLFVAAVMLAMGQLAVSAQEPSPEASPTPTGCSVAPLPVSFIADLLAVPKPDPLPTAVVDVPRGQPVDDTTAREIAAVITELSACTNAGDYLRAFALFESEYLRRIIDPDGLMTDEVALELGKSLAEVTPADEDTWTTLVGIDSIEQLDDGTVIAVFRTFVGTDPDDEQTDMFALRKVGERWLIVDGRRDITT